jgi:NTE family protein
LFNNQINRNFNSLKSYFGFGLKYQYTNLKPKNDPEFNTNIYKLYSYYADNIELSAQYSYNTLSDVFFASKGSLFQASVGRSLLNDIEFNYSEPTIENVSGKTNGYTKVSLNFEQRYLVSKKITGIVGATACFIFQDKLKSNQLSFNEFGYAAKYFLGGTLISPGNNRFVFNGLNEDELNLSQFIKLNFSLQTKLYSKTYITPHFDIASIGFNDFNYYIENVLSPKGKWQERIDTSLLMSAGATFSYNSFLGPITFDTSWVNQVDKIKLFFSIGIFFNSSN